MVGAGFGAYCVAIAMPGPERLPAGPTRDFVTAVHALYDAAGRPGARVISQGIRRDLSLRETVSHETISAVLRGASLPGWAKVRSIVIELSRESIAQPDRGATVARFQRLWLAAQAEPSSATAETSAVAPAQVAVPGTLASAQFPPSITRAMSTGLVRAVPLPHPVAPHALPGGRIIGELPDRNPHFIGREILLDHMHAHLTQHPHTPLVLFGLSGAGKTQLAREYLHRYTADCPVVWWVPADRARSSMVGLAERLRVPMPQSSEQKIAGVISWLEAQRNGFVLVFDAVADEEVRRLMPTIGGHVIVTSRDPAWAYDSSSTGLEVPDFDRAEAIQFLRRRANQLSGQQADELAQVLGRLPLALEQITALQVATGMPWDDLLSRLNGSAAGLLSTGQPAHYPHTVAASLQLALSQLATADPVAELLFELFAWFGSEPVSVALLRSGRTGDISAPLLRALRDPVQLNRAIATISRYGLARLHAHVQRIEVQPLMRRALRDALSADAGERARRNVHQILAAADPGWPDGLPSWDLHREMAPHVLPTDLIHSRTPAAQRTVYHQIRYRYLIGDYEDARRLGETAITAWRQEDFLGANHGLVLRASREWANALRSLGQYQRCRELTSDALDRFRANPEYGDDHPYTLAMALSRAADLRIEGKYYEALRADTDVHRRHTTRYGETHDRTAGSRHNLAVSLRLVGDFATAASVDEAQLEGHRQNRGDEYGKTVLSAYALAEDLYGLGRYRDALDLQTRYAETGRRVLGATHQSTILARRTIALAQRGLGQVVEALTSLRDHYHDCIAAFGPDHEYTLVATMSYANTLRQHSRFDEAHMHATDAVSAYRRTFGRTNPLTLAAEVNLGAILRAKGERNSALQADTIAEEALRGLLGRRHPFTVAARMNLATDIWLAGEYRRALRMSELVYTDVLEVRGHQNPYTLAAAANLAIDRGAAGETDAGDRLLDEALAGLRRTLGPAHPNVTAAASGVRLECTIEPPST